MCHILNDEPPLIFPVRVTYRKYPSKKKAIFLWKAREWYLPVLLFISFITTIPAICQVKDINYQPVRTPDYVPVNYTQPKGILKPGDMITATFSKVPTD